MVLELQAFGVLFSVVMLYLSYVYFRKDTYGVRSFAVWACVWVAGGLLLLFPQWFRGLAQSLQFTRVTDFYVSLAIMFLGLVTFFNFVHMKRQGKLVENLVRTIAIDSGRRPKKSK
jgi:hypothetical protein